MSNDKVEKKCEALTRLEGNATTLATVQAALDTLVSAGVPSTARVVVGYVAGVGSAVTASWGVE